MVCNDKWHSVVRVLFFVLDEVFSVNTTCFVKTMVNARIVVTSLFQIYKYLYFSTNHIRDMYMYIVCCCVTSFIYRLMHALFHIRTVIIPRDRYRPEGFSPRVDIGRGMKTVLIWKRACINLFITYFNIELKRTKLTSHTHTHTHNYV